MIHQRSSRSSLIVLSLLGLLSNAHGVSSEPYTRIADRPYTTPFRMGVEDVDKIQSERHQSRAEQFNQLFRLVKGDRRYERWAGLKRSECVRPLNGIWSTDALVTPWTDRCLAMVGETEAFYTFAFNPYQKTNTLQHIAITVPGTEWKMKKRLIAHVSPLLGKAVPTLPKGSPKGSALVWKWKAGKGQATLTEEYSPFLKMKVTRFVWYRPAEAPKASVVVKSATPARPTQVRLRIPQTRS